MAGSSPRVRGTDDKACRVKPAGRFIPACAGNSAGVTRRKSGQSVHPRVCGEQTDNPLLVARSSGSSPRVRGTAGPHTSLRRNRRFIPACAGNSARDPRYLRLRPVHPRVCGEQNIFVSLMMSFSGSSPRVRGTDRRERQFTLYARFIPACAGNSWNRPCRRNKKTVHPRVCGEQLGRLPFLFAHAGSSPRVRGTDTGSRRTTGRRRFIPACAGNRPYHAHTHAHTSVHPRVCGEQELLMIRLDVETGSSPRVRGTAGRRDPRPSIVRFIPACAGNSFSAVDHAEDPAVHPRVCGEQRRGRIWYTMQPGSSPRVRGTVTNSTTLAIAARFIPACAGNRFSPQKATLHATVHPRVCGEQSRLMPLTLCVRGSSPRVRGTAQPRQRQNHAARFIPACAGNSASSWRPIGLIAVHPRVCGEQLRRH